MDNIKSPQDACEPPIQNCVTMLGSTIDELERTTKILHTRLETVSVPYTEKTKDPQVAMPAEERVSSLEASMHTLNQRLMNQIAILNSIMEEIRL